MRDLETLFVPSTEARFERAHVRNAMPEPLHLGPRGVEREPLVDMEIRDRDGRRAVESRIAVEVDAAARLDQARENRDDLAEARDEIPIVAVGHRDAMEGEAVLAVRTLAG